MGQEGRSSSTNSTQGPCWKRHSPASKIWSSQKKSWRCTKARRMAAWRHVGGDRVDLSKTKNEILIGVRAVTHPNACRRFPMMFYKCGPVSKRVNSSRAPDDDPTVIEQVDIIEFR